MIKLGILTFHSAHYFGALLQSYALRSYLKSRYEYVDIINYAPRALTKRYDLFPYFPYQKTPAEFKNALLVMFRNIRCLPAFLQRRRKMRHFIKEYLAVSGNKLKSANDLEHCEYDCFIMGSDQIWNPDITLGMDKVFYGEFARPASSKCVAYAASFGKNRLENRHVEDFKQYISNFVAISMRESSAVPFVRSFAACPVQVACDPVFLLSGEQWRMIAQAAQIERKQKYLLVYYSEYNKYITIKQHAAAAEPANGSVRNSASRCVRTRKASFIHRPASGARNAVCANRCAQSGRYNVQDYIGRYLDSVLRQTYPNIEIILVDDGSTDATAQIIES